MVRRFVTVVAIALVFVIAATLVALHTHPDLSRWSRFQPASSDLTPAEQALALTWLGTSTLLISDGTTHLLTDGFFSRPSLWSLTTGPIAPDQDAINAALTRHHISSLDAVLVVHSHYDHAMDAPLVARATRARLVGSASTLNIGKGLGLTEEDMLLAEAGKPMQFGEFTLTFLLSDHVPQNALVDAATGMDETVDAPLTPPAWINAWKEAESWVLMIEHPFGNILIQGSAGYRPGQVDGYKADLALVSSVGLFRQPDSYQQAYYDNTVAAVDAKTVVPLHWDDFFSPLRDDMTPALPWLVENLNGSFASLVDRSLADERRFLLIRPGQTWWYHSPPAGPASTP